MSKTNAKHTPGPWRLCTKFCQQGLIAPVDGVYPVAAVTGYYGHANQTEANARLIAAAPELLQVIELVSDLSSQEWQDADGKRHAATDNQGRRFWFISEDVMQAVRSVRAKAGSAA